MTGHVFPSYFPYNFVLALEFRNSSFLLLTSRQAVGVNELARSEC